MTTNSLFLYLAELNIAFLVLYGAYKLFFEKDKNFVIRRIYLLWILVLPFILPLIPETVRMAVNSLAPVSFSIEEITIYANGTASTASGSFSIGDAMICAYLLILGFGIAKLGFQLWGIFRAIIRADYLEMDGKKVVSNSRFHASSFFGFIFMDPAYLPDPTASHILEHEQIHKKELHSIDRILVELFAMINWFNPVVWIYRKSVIENLEYLADSAVVNRGADPLRYQLSILNQYIGSASITNQFSSQIKKRINMLNQDYKLGSRWKLILIFPLAVIAFVAISCSDKDSDASLKAAKAENTIYFEVDEMPTLNGEDPVMPFRKFITQNMIYPEQAIEHKVSGKIFVKFVVRKDGTVEIPTPEEIATSEGIPIDEVVVVGYRPIDEKAPAVKEEYIELLKNEAIRVVTLSPRWEPGKVDGKPVDVMYTFPISFVLQ
jgi:beta-lactamase regulating signal transducer with metallopeptidase domain